MNEVAALFGEIQQLRVLIRKGVIVISAHHQHQNVVNRVERFLTKVKNGEPLNVASLFHGGGILDASAHAGMSAAGIKSRIAVAVEVEDKYLESSMACNKKLWDSDSIAINSPIELVELNRGKPTDIQCLIGGIPCTGASLAGRAKNKLARAEDHSSAGALFFYFLEFARVLNPAVVVIENVEAYANTASMSVIRSVLNSLGYHVQETVLDGAQWVLERRKRLAVVAISEGLDVDFDINDIQPTRTKESSISDILEDIPLASDRWKPFEYLAIKEAADKAAGKGFARQLLSSDADGCGVIGRSYAKCRSTEPFLKHPQDESLSRLFTPLEHCRLKGCPEYLIEGLSDTLAHEILGQSIVFPAFKDLFICLGKSIQRFCG
ncbi:MAG: DNA cytosine methyltransferase [Shewanella fodinae]|nr:DNA cytosine methyltransferase [Shewanella fodinae]